MRFLVCVLFLIFVSCTEHKAPTPLQKLEEKLAVMTKELGVLDAKHKSSPYPENRVSLKNDRDLLVSRIERVKEEIKNLKAQQQP